MALPNPGMVFTPFDPLPASDMNDLVENDQALAAGTGLNDASVTAEKIKTGTIWQAYIPGTSLTATEKIVKTVTLPNTVEARNYKIEISWIFNNSNVTPLSDFYAAVKDGTTILRNIYIPATAYYQTGSITYVLTSTSGVAPVINMTAKRGTGTGAALHDTSHYVIQDIGTA